jgi:hypothetical protein
MEYVKQAVLDFMNNLHAYKNRVGLIKFSDKVVILSRLTSNFEDIKATFNYLTPSGFESNIKDALQHAIFMLKQREKTSIPIIILITDGGEDKSTIDDKTLLDSLRAEGISLYVFNIGRSTNIESFLRSACEETRGMYKVIEPSTLSQYLYGISVGSDKLSAANIKIQIRQTDDAVVDYYSVQPKWVGTSALRTYEIDKFTYLIPKLKPNEEIELEFYSVPYHTGHINIAKIVIEYMDKDGSIKTFEKCISYDVPSPLPTWIPLLILIIGVGIAIISITYTFRVRGRIKDALDYIKSIEGHIEDIVCRQYIDNIQRKLK